MYALLAHVVSPASSTPAACQKHRRFNGRTFSPQRWTGAPRGPCTIRQRAILAAICANAPTRHPGWHEIKMHSAEIKTNFLWKQSQLATETVTSFLKLKYIWSESILWIFLIETKKGCRQKEPFKRMQESKIQAFLLDIQDARIQYSFCCRRRAVAYQWDWLMKPTINLQHIHIKPGPRCHPLFASFVLSLVSALTFPIFRPIYQPSSFAQSVIIER